MTPELFGTVDYWRRRARGETPERDPLFDKRQKQLHRYTIADVNGPLTLTIPIVKPHGIPHARWSHVGISSHGQWWHIHRQALASAYSRTPFYEYYIDRLLPLLSPDTPRLYPTVTALLDAADAILTPILLPNGADAPRCIPTSLIPFGNPASAEYWQPRRQQLGFIPGLCVLDLLFCVGPEAPIYIYSDSIIYNVTQCCR